MLKLEGSRNKPTRWFISVPTCTQDVLFLSQALRLRKVKEIYDLRLVIV